MEVKVEKLEKNRVSLEVELGADQVDKALDQASPCIKKVNPGFGRAAFQENLGNALGQGFMRRLWKSFSGGLCQGSRGASLEPIDQPQIETSRSKKAPFAFLLPLR